MKITGSEAIMHSLIQEGVDTIFGYPGGAIMPAYDALYHFSKEIRHILVRHEQGASHAAQGYARMTGKAGVVLVTSGPGATNLVTGIADAMLDSVPLVCITGQVAKDYLGTDAFQETDIIGVTMPITKWNCQISSSEEIAETFAKAFFIAQNGRPGPVLIDITKNAQVDKLDFTYKKISEIKNFNHRPSLNIQAIEQAAEIINQAKRPYIFVGHGVLIAQAQKELLHVMERSGIPAASTLHGLSALPTRHPLYVGMLGMHGNYGPNVLTNEADVIIAIGMRFDDRVTGNLKQYATKAKIIHIDIDAAEIGKNLPTEVSINADAKEALEALLPLLKENNHEGWISKFNECHQLEFEKVIKHSIHPDSKELKMSEVINLLSEKTNGQAVLVGDVGQHQMMAARYYQFQHNNSWVTSGGLGTMGFALPAAIGAKIAVPEREVVVIVGDGGFQMTLQELGTIAQENLAVKIIILNNNFLGMVRQWQELFFEGRYSFVDLKNPDFVMVTQGFGVPAARIDTREQLGPALDKMLQSKGPYLLDIRVEKEQNVFPMVASGASVTDIRLE